MRTSSINADELVGASTPAHTLKSIMDALNQGKVSEVADQFDDRFTFKDHALDIEFTDKKRLIEFFRKSRESFPDSAVEVESTFACGDPDRVIRIPAIPLSDCRGRLDEHKR